jgi:hypothetical protein
MQVYKAFGSNPEYVPDLPLTSLYKLAAPSTPEAARDLVIERASEGERLTPAQVKEIIDRAIQTERADVEAQLAAVRADAERREAAVRAEYDGKLVMDPEGLRAEISKVVAPLQRQIKEYEAQLKQVKREQSTPLNEDFLSPSEADRAIGTVAKHLDTALLNPSPGITACLVEAMARASAEDRTVIAAAAEFLSELAEHP